MSDLVIKTKIACMGIKGTLGGGEQFEKALLYSFITFLHLLL